MRQPRQKEPCLPPLLTLFLPAHGAGRFVVGELVAALAHVHEQGVLYGDLKPENILVHSSGHIKLSDFGSARRMDSIQAGDRVEVRHATATVICCIVDAAAQGTAEYLPPEVVHGDAPSLAADMWALGCVVYQLFAGRPPLWAEQQGDLFRQIVSFDVGDAFPPSFPEPAADLVRLLLQTDPGARPTVAEVRKHRFFEGMDVMRLHEQVREARPPCVLIAMTASHRAVCGRLRPSLRGARWRRGPTRGGRGARTP